MMRRLAPAIAVAALILISCSSGQEEKVMARYVPERADDFVFENDLICGRIYGKALEGDPTSPGIDIWVKTPGELVADRRYRDELENGKSYHIDHGDGKDCYKVSVSLGGGASAPLIDGEIQYPATNYREWEILEKSSDMIRFILRYPEWEACGVRISLDKTITVKSGSYFCKVEDLYRFSGTDSLEIAAGVFRHPEQNTIEREYTGTGSYAIWEHASDQSAEPEDGMIGVSIYVPGADAVRLTESGDHGLCISKKASGEIFTYWFGSCWSKGGIRSAEEWFALVEGLAVDE